MVIFVAIVAGVWGVGAGLVLLWLRSASAAEEVLRNLLKTGEPAP